MRVIHIALKDLRLLARDPMALFWAFGFPIAFALFIGSVLSSSVSRDSARVPVVIVDDARTDGSRRLKAELEQKPGLSLKNGEDVERARESVRRGEQSAYVRLAPDFDRHGQLEIGLDPSRVAESALLRGALLEALRPESTSARASPLREVAVLRQPPPSPFSLAFPGAIAWGLMGCAATFAAAMVRERTGGTLIRLRAAPMGKATLLLGKALACAIACVFDVLVLLAVARLGFGVRIENVPGLALALTATTACFVGLTQFLSSLGRTEESVSGAGWATLLFLAMLGGAMVPVSFMPEWMQRLSDLSPIRWGILALEGALWRGLGPRELLLPCAILGGVGAIAFAFGLQRTQRL
jgi:ABC-2 type transport system permease protein